MDRRLEPAHDRVHLTPAERATWATVERTLADEFVGGRLAPRRVERRTLPAVHHLRRVLPWLVALLVAATLVAGSMSTMAGLIWTLLLTAALTGWVTISLDRLRAGIRLRRPPTDRRP
jgi:hypothetical protein